MSIWCLVYPVHVKSAGMHLVDMAIPTYDNANSRGAFGQMTGMMTVASVTATHNRIVDSSQTQYD